MRRSISLSPDLETASAPSAQTMRSTSSGSNPPKPVTRIRAGESTAPRLQSTIGSATQGCSLRRSRRRISQGAEDRDPGCWYGPDRCCEKSKKVSLAIDLDPSSPHFLQSPNVQIGLSVLPSEPLPVHLECESGLTAYNPLDALFRRPLVHNNDGIAVTLEDSLNRRREAGRGRQPPDSVGVVRA